MPDGSRHWHKGWQQNGQGQRRKVQEGKVPPKSLSAFVGAYDVQTEAINSKTQAYCYHCKVEDHDDYAKRDFQRNYC